MRDDLLGYLLDALDPPERSRVEEQLARDPMLQQDLTVLRRALEPLAADQEHFDPPPRLADRTCEFVAMESQVMLAPAGTGSAARWRLADFVVAATIFLAASLLVFPALYHSRYAARLTGCQENLRQLGLALTSYSRRHQGFFPDVPRDGNLAAVGIYAVKLIDNGFLTDHHTVVCPASALADQVEPFRVPTLAELSGARPEQLPALHRTMGGSYGYSLGHRVGSDYQSTRNLGRTKFALMADAPDPTTLEHNSPNHGCGGQNVLFEDQHVNFLTSCNVEGCRDNYFVNDEGRVAPGVHENDAVIGASSVRPFDLLTADEPK